MTEDDTFNTLRRVPFATMFLRFWNSDYELYDDGAKEMILGSGWAMGEFAERCHALTDKEYNKIIHGHEDD